MFVSKLSGTQNIFQYKIYKNKQNMIKSYLYSKFTNNQFKDYKILQHHMIFLYLKYVFIDFAKPNMNWDYHIKI